MTTILYLTISKGDNFIKKIDLNILVFDYDIFVSDYLKLIRPKYGKNSIYRFTTLEK